jgi:hypothetical protein
MMKVKMLPCISAYDLEEALELQYGFEVAEGAIFAMIPEERINSGTIVPYTFIKYDKERWEKQEPALKCIDTFLADAFPDLDTIYIYLDW